MRPSVRSFRRLAELALLALAVAPGCGLSKSGTASVSAELDPPECQPGKARNTLREISFNAGYMATERFAGILIIMIQKHRVNVEETDGLAMRVDLSDLLASGQMVVDSENDQFVRADPTTPLTLEVSQDPDGTNASLSLFQTCPEHPTHRALSGQLVFTAITLAYDPQDTGRMEHLAGTLTATLTRANADGRKVGTLHASFDFAPPRRPLTDFK